MRRRARARRGRPRRRRAPATARRRGPRAVICNVTPTQLYGRARPPDGHGAEKAERFRYGRSEMQIHFALSEPPRWDGDERLGRTAIVHLTPGLDGVSRAVNEAERGLLPAEATIVVGQPLTIDPCARTRRHGDPLDPAAGATVARQGRRGGRARRRRRDLDGEPARALRRPHPGTPRTAHPEPRVVDPRARRLSPADLAGGEHQPRPRRSLRRLARLDQNFLWRPLAAQPGHRTPVDGALAHRRVDTPRPRPRRRLRHARRAAAARAALRTRMLNRLRGAG